MEISIGINQPDQEAVDPKGQHLENVVVTELGVRLRPGCVTSNDLGTSAKVDGIFDWVEENCVIAVSNGNVFKFTATGQGAEAFYLLLESGDSLLLEDSGALQLEPGGGSVDVTGANDMVVGTRVIFANFGNGILYMANGAQIQELHASQSFVTHGGKNWSCKLNNYSVAGAAGNEPGVATATATYWNDLGAGSGYDAWAAGVRYGSGLAQRIEDADAPTTVKWIGVLDTYLLAIEAGTERVWFSIVTEPWSWDSDLFSAESVPDTATCLRVQDGDIYIGGQRSIQMWTNDGATPFVESGYGAISHGVVAPYSFTWCPTPGTFIWLDDQRRLVRLEGRTAVVVNHSLDTFLNRVSSVTDAIADFIVIDGVPFYILQFPTNEITVALNLDNNTWSEWYSTQTNQYRWLASCMTNVQAWDLTIIGDTRDGKLKILSSDLDTEDGTAITAKIRSPRNMTGSVVRVGDVALALTKVGRTTSTTAASLTVRWRDDGQDWLTARTVTVDDDSKTDFVKHVRRCGHYRNNRQYEFNVSSMWPYALQRVEQI